MLTSYIIFNVFFTEKLSIIFKYFFVFLQELIAQTRAKSNLKAKTAESEGKLLCNQCQASMFPDAEGFYEFESNFILCLFPVRDSNSEFESNEFNIPKFPADLFICIWFAISNQMNSK